MDIYNKLSIELQYEINIFLQNKKMFNRVIHELLELNFYYSFFGKIYNCSKLQLYKFYINLR